DRCDYCLPVHLLFLSDAKLLSPLSPQRFADSVRRRQTSTIWQALLRRVFSMCASRNAWLSAVKRTFQETDQNFTNALTLITSKLELPSLRVTSFRDFISR